jgi:hypothetical protein
VSKPKFDTEEVVIALHGPTGNAYAVMGLAAGAMKRAGAEKEEIVQYHAEATASDYENLLAVTRRWVNLTTI